MRKKQKILLFLSIFFFIFICFNIAFYVSTNGKINEYKNNNIRVLLIPEFYGIDYTFIDENRVLYSSGSGNIIIYNILLQKKENVINIKNKINYKDFSVYNFIFNEKDNCVYFLLHEGNAEHFFSLNISKETLKEYMELKNRIDYYWVEQEKNKQFLYFHKPYVGEEIMYIYDLSSEQIISSIDFPNEAQGYSLCCFNKENNTLLFFDINFSNNYSIQEQCFYLYNIMGNEGNLFEDFIIDRNKFIFEDYINLFDYKYLCRDHKTGYSNNMYEIDFAKNSVKKIFQNELYGNIYNLKRYKDNTFCFLATFGKNKKFLCFFEYLMR